MIADKYFEPMPVSTGISPFRFKENIMHLKSEKTVLTISNAIALSAAIIEKIAGNEIANTLNGSTLTSSALHDIIGSQINKNFSNFTNQGVPV